MRGRGAFAGVGKVLLEDKSRRKRLGRIQEKRCIDPRGVMGWLMRAQVAAHEGVRGGPLGVKSHFEGSHRLIPLFVQNLL